MLILSLIVVFSCFMDADTFSRYFFYFAHSNKGLHEEQLKITEVLREKGCLQSKARKLAFSIGVKDEKILCVIDK